MNPDYLEITDGIALIIATWENKLINLETGVISNRFNVQNRTIKQILGHLIDSASNNHQRMIRLQYNSELVFPDYRQDNDRWIAIQNYQDADWINLVQLWKFFNLHMIQVIQSIDNSKLQNVWKDFEGTSVTLDQMIVGYLDHLNLHMNEIQVLTDNE